MALSCFQFRPRGVAIETLLAHLPPGVAWLAFRIRDKVASKLFEGFAKSYEDASTALCNLFTEVDYRTAIDLIGEWEEAVSLPDSCLPEASTLEQRRAWVRFRLDKRRWSTAQDWKDLAALFDLDIAITPGWYVQEPALYAIHFPGRYDLFPKLGRFRVYINVRGAQPFGYDYGVQGRGPGYPVPYGYEEQYAQFKCIIERVKPANVVVIWDHPLEESAYGICVSDSFDDNFAAEFC